MENKGGITLLSIGSEGYLFFAACMAATIRHYSPTIQIQLVCDKNIRNKIARYGFEKVFDVFTEMDETDFTDNNHLAPGKAKLKLPLYFQFNRTMYLDVDGCIIKDISPLFELPGIFIGHVHETFKLGEVKQSEGMLWANSESILNFYELKPETALPALNTSFYMVDKCDETDKLFKQARENMLQNPMPRNIRFRTWGRGDGLQPDELYLNIACAQTGIYPNNCQPIYFRHRNKPEPNKEINQLRQNWYGIGLYGGTHYNHPSLNSVYDRHVRPIWQAAFPKAPFMKAHQLMTYKIANGKFIE